jgi:hypothetical protein
MTDLSHASANMVQRNGGPTALGFRTAAKHATQYEGSAKSTIFCSDLARRFDPSS